MKLAINAVSAKTGGAATYLQNVLVPLRDELPAGSDIVVWRGPASGQWPPGFDYREDRSASGAVEARTTWSRLWFDQVKLRLALRAERTDTLFSTANFGMLHPPCRQALLVRNSAYFDETYMSRLRAPKLLAYHRLQRWLTLQSIKASEVVLFPSAAMRDLVASHAGGVGPSWLVAHYGTLPELFTPGEPKPTSATIELLHVGLYSDQKNLGTLLRALRLLAHRTSDRYRLTLTAAFDSQELEHYASCPRFREERELYQELRTAGAARAPAPRPYRELPELYGQADIFVFPSYTESFGHPLVEAMASGLPIVASDTPVNRELCLGAALYFPAFDIGACAEQIARLGEDSALRARLREAAIERARAFSWPRHAAIVARALEDDARATP